MLHVQLACSALRPVVSSNNIHGSPYTPAHILVQHKMAKNLRMALCCQNQVSKLGTNQHYGLHSSASISVHCASVTVLGLLKKKMMKQSVQNGVSQ